MFDMLRGVDPVAVDGDSLASMVLGLQSLQNWVESRSMVWLAEFAQRGQWAADGSRSLAAWVEERSHSPAKRVAAQGKLGQALRFMPVTRAAALRGELSQTPLRLLASCPTEATAELFDVKETELVATELVGWATSMRQREFQQVLRCWAAHADPDDITVAEPESPLARPDPARRHATRRTLRIPRLRSATLVVRCASLPTLGTRRANQPRQRRPPLSTPPQLHPQSKMVCKHQTRPQTNHPQTRRNYPHNPQIPDNPNRPKPQERPPDTQRTIDNQTTNLNWRANQQWGIVV